MPAQHRQCAKASRDKMSLEMSSPNKCNGPQQRHITSIMRILDGVDVVSKIASNLTKNSNSFPSTHEDMLARWIHEAEAAGHAFNHAQFREMASIVNRASGGTGKIGKNWTTRFL